MKFNESNIIFALCFAGNYFSSHFIMGGERFDTALPEMYLFGENMDLNFLGSRPAPVSALFFCAVQYLFMFGDNLVQYVVCLLFPCLQFPYPAPSASEPSKTLKALINIRKESLRFVKVAEETSSLKDSEPVTDGKLLRRPPLSITLNLLLMVSC